MSEKPPRYSIGVGMSMTDLGVLWPVVQHHGKCGCGSVEMKRTIGYFTSRQDAEEYVSMAAHRDEMMEPAE